MITMNSPMELIGRNLGEKHHHFNGLVTEAFVNETYNLDEFNSDEGDILNLMKIDIASKTRNIDYVMKVLVCDDILYVSRVIKQCPWLVSDPEYHNVINPDYLHKTLFPRMNIKCVNKFKKFIQLHLEDTTCAEEFYINEKCPDKAVNWLPKCSPDFILQNVSKHTSNIKISQIRRLCEKTILVLEQFVDANSCISKSKIFEATVCMVNSNNINNYLNFVEKLQYYDFPKFGKSATSSIMKLAPDRIFVKFDDYCNFIHLPTFIKVLESKNIKNFLLEQALKSEEQKKPLAIFGTKKLRYFFQSMPKEECFDFIRKIFIDKIHTQKTDLSDSEIKAMGYIYNCVKNKRWFNELQFYQYAPFDIALTHIKELITKEPQSVHLNVMFSTLISNAKQNDQNIKHLLQYFQDKQTKAQYELRYHFINDIICCTNFPKFDESVWNILEDLMMLDITDVDIEVQKYLDAVIIYKVLHSDSIPEIVQKRFHFHSLNTYKHILNKEDKMLLFDYLHNQINIKLKSSSLETEKDFKETMTLLDTALNLLNDWDKNLQDYPLILNKIKELVCIKKENSWVYDLSFIYNKNKSWKKLLFEESFSLYPGQTVFINAIKHDSTMFERYKYESEQVCLKEKESVIQFLRKIKVYWSQSLSKVWADFYINRLNDLNSQRVSSRGVCILLPQPELLAILNKYVPENAKIDYGNIDELNLNLQRCFAKNMHIARPQPPPEMILLYAKGDYLICSLPSLLSIYYNISEDKSEKYISELLNRPVSLQKHAIRFSLTKIKSHEIPALFSKVWESSANTTIRSVLFKTVFDFLCKEKDSQAMDALWNLLAMFIENLTFNENKIVYKTLFKVGEVPQPVRANFFVESFKFLTKLYISNSEYNDYGVMIKNTLFPYAREIIEDLPPSFVAKILLQFINNDFIKESSNTYTMQSNLQVITAYLLCAKDEVTQTQKYEEIFLTIINICSASINENKCKDYCIKNLDMLLVKLCEDVKFAFEKKFILPIKMFSSINNELVKLFSESENYLTLTKWSLVLLFTKNLGRQHGNDWNELCIAAAPQFGKQCLEILIEHCKKYFSRVYILFVNALDNVLNTFVQDNTIARLKICECLLHNKDFVQGYLAVLHLYHQNNSKFDEELNEQAKNLRQNILQHSSLEVKMHYYSIINEENLQCM